MTMAGALVLRMLVAAREEGSLVSDEAKPFTNTEVGKTPSLANIWSGVTFRCMRGLLLQPPSSASASFLIVASSSFRGCSPSATYPWCRIPTQRDSHHVHPVSRARRY